MSDVDAVLQSVGPRLRAARLQRDTTLTQLSETTGISISTLSRLESGQRRATLELLLPLTRALQVPLDSLLDEPASADPRVHHRPIERNGMTMLPLTRRPGGLQAYKMILPPGWPTGERELRTHEGYEWLYVLNGRFVLHLGSQELVLMPGEVVEFDTHVPHLLSNPGPAPVELLALFGPQGERMHVRARPARTAD
ncbi:helix-turn-helix transcriptional regulator [Modestobacter muralis]|uniref:Helix-turn-helix transcriptional regulator n=1 Tax=Modestobacter muralis TaxID=1608614 RepID=A0A6P0H2N8_9ACTN|nr:XRE family transcriptional regulator [Modestobacter muralis]NEK92668.1 helix-turn-helix transcriptional regulator [Modestobacter muralis]NEN49435.1 helix-turn-helix transcriptional regulator [Modestobacter muralis]